MELVPLLRELWRLRVAVAVIGAVAVLVGLAVAFQLPSLESRKYDVGLATARVFVDTPASQVVKVAPKGSDALGVRANLIANLMVEGDVKAAIAQKAGLAPEQLIGIPETAVGPAPDLGAAPAKASVLSTRVSATPDGNRLPIIEVEAQAPDAAAAARLAEASITGLRDYLDSKAAAESVSDAERLRVSGLGTPQAREVARGPRTVFALAAVLFVFIAGCGALLGALALLRGWRVAAAVDQQLGEFDEQMAAFDAMLADPALVQEHEGDRVTSPYDHDDADARRR
jgi:hypothetical protein